MTELAKTNEQGLEEFNKLKSTIDEMAKSLFLIKVTDDTSMAVANQQLSRAKQIDKDVDNRHALVKEEALRFCQAADLAKRTIKSPLAPATLHVETELLNYNRKVEADKKAEIAKLEAEQERLKKTAADESKNLVAQMQEFEARAFNLIVSANLPAELSSVYTVYVIAFPPTYDVVIKERIMKLGKAKLNFLQALDVNVKNEMDKVWIEMHQEFTNTKPVIAAPIITMPSFDAIEIKKSVIENQVSSNIKKTWKHEVVVLEAVPMAWLVIDESKVKAFIKENSDKFTDGEIINGIKYFLESSVKIK